MELLDYLILNDKVIKSLLKLLQPKRKEFEKGEMILKQGAAENGICLVLKGTAYLCVENDMANRQLLDFFTKGQLICPEMMPTPHNGHCYVLAKYPCSVAWLRYEDFLPKLTPASGIALSEPVPTHGTAASGLSLASVAAPSARLLSGSDISLPELLLRILRAAVSDSNAHCHMLQQKTVREKLLAFLHYQSLRQNRRAVHVPIPYSDLADYLTIDRSALMTELSKMHAEGLIEKKAHDIRLC